MNGLTENFGGTAGNIAYSLALLGENPRIVATIGQDYHRYFEWLAEHGLGAGNIRIVEDELTAGAYITTDEDNNQITGFNPGAMKQQAGFDFDGIDPGNTIAIVAPGNLQDMAELTARHQALGIFTIFDPGQSLPIWEGEGLARAIGQSDLLVCNAYELEMIVNRTGQSHQQLAGSVDHIVVTKGEQGADLLTGDDSVSIPGVPADPVVDPDRRRRRLPGRSDQRPVPRRKPGTRSPDGQRMRSVRGPGPRHPDLQLHHRTILGCFGGPLRRLIHRVGSVAFCGVGAGVRIVAGIQEEID